MNMKINRISLTIVMFLLSAVMLMAGNTKKTVGQVTSAVDLTDDVDYVIIGSTPFATAGSVNIVNTEHAVVIFQKIKPSVVKSTYMNNIFINGEKAVDGTNCQVKMYNRGAIVFPYGSDFKPLTCYTEKGFEGESYNGYVEGTTDGYMRTLSSVQLLNNFKSFKLKRGYMVTFALGTSGWGYSRVFIADQEDLEMDLPTNMSGRVSSYRLFRWVNAHKAGLASNGDATANAAVGSCWCYDWGTGNASLLPDVEWVPNHIYEDWPSSAACGSVTGSCHMKTNNEPGNNSDDHPQTVDVVLDNWQNLMRTGMRLCSESSHDGSWSHLQSFIKEIDARGWRCDLLDLHCYWDSGSFGDFSNYYNNYGGRPVWISEWVWGASWNKNGFWARTSTPGECSTSNQQICYDGTVPILQKLNASKYVERYAYWNSEAAGTHIYDSGNLTKLGEYYASMDEGLGYNADIQKIPTIVYNTPTDLVAKYSTSNGICGLGWNDANGDMLDSMVVQCKRPGSSDYKWIGNVKLRDMSAKTGAHYSFNDTPEPGTNYYRVAAYPIGNRTPKYSDVVSVSVSSSLGDSTLQYGMLEVANLDEVTTDFTESFATTPLVFTGLYTMRNTTTTPYSLIKTTGASQFTYQIIPWSQSGTQTITSAEKVAFMAKEKGNYTYGDMVVEVGQAKAKSEATYIEFEQPFAEGVKPVVVVDLKPTYKTTALIVRIWDVTNKGFYATVDYEGGAGKTVTLGQNLSYIACTPGQGKITDTMYITAGIGTKPLYGATYSQMIFRATNLDGTVDEDADTLMLNKPYIFGTFQTKNYPAGAIARRFLDMTRTADDGTSYTYGTRVRRVLDSSDTSVTTKDTEATADTLGWICLSSAPAPEYVNEDVNQDGNVDTQDVLKIYEFMKAGGEPDDDTREDVNSDEAVDTQDVLKVYEYMKEN